MPILTGSVGLRGGRRREDILLVQLLLTQAGVFSDPENGICGRSTIEAIERFQHAFMPHPTGRVDPHSETWTRLQAVPSPAPVPGRVAEAGMATMRMEAAQMTMLAGISRSAAPLFNAVATKLAAAGDARAYWTGLTRMSPPADVNGGLICPRSHQMIALLGEPKSKTAAAHRFTMIVGPFRLYGLTAALESPSRIFATVLVELPNLSKLLGEQELFDARLERNSTTNWSNHSWGAAIDLKIDNKLFQFGSQFSMRGLDALVPYFNAAGWYWGGGYHTGTRNDPMHFECGLALLHSFGQ